MAKNSQSLERACALVTGAQQGIGAATAVALARSGADVAVHWLDDQAAAETVAADVQALGRRAILVQGDVSKSAEVTRFVDEARDGLGGLSVLVNNAGVFPRSDFLELTEAEWDQVHGVNLKGSFLVAQAVARAMVEAGGGGAIVNLSSSSVRGHPLGAHYSASKTGIVGLTRAMALALAEHGIRVNAVAPGLTDTAQPRVEFSDDELTERGKLIPLGGAIADPADIAEVIAFLASDAARFITGELVHANGGLYMA
jgi:NAD(P)-dependent dehydrogenase (short-subunit alcohol dehydrogenase family)